MRTPAAPTYLLPDDDVVDGRPWRDADGIELGETIDHWDPATDVRLSRVLTIDVDALRQQCRLGPDSALAIVAVWRAATRTRLGGAGEITELGTTDGLVRASVTIDVPGPESGGRLDLTTRVVLRSPGAAASAISPRRPGAVLWTETQRVSLEGAASRFPMTAVDFATLPRVPDRAAWYVDWDHEELDAPVLGNLRLLLNTAHPRIINAVRTASDDPAAVIVRSMIQNDVARHLVRTALENEAFVASPETFADDSIGRLLSDLIKTVWPDITPRALRARALGAPARVDAELQAGLELAE